MNMFTHDAFPHVVAELINDNCNMLQRDDTDGIVDVFHNDAQPQSVLREHGLLH